MPLHFRREPQSLQSVQKLKDGICPDPGMMSYSTNFKKEEHSSRFSVIPLFWHFLISFHWCCDLSSFCSTTVSVSVMAFHDAAHTNTPHTHGVLKIIPYHVILFPTMFFYSPAGLWFQGS